MGTAIAMHAARLGHDVRLWANPHDDEVLRHLRGAGRHPRLGEHLPASLAIHGPDELDAAAADAEIAVMGANSHGARSLARMVAGSVKGVHTVVSLAKGLEPDSRRRMSEVYGDELPWAGIVAVGGPCLAAELAGGQPTAGVWASRDIAVARAAGASFDHRTYQLVYTDDIAGLELSATMKNVAAIGLGMLDGIGAATGEDFKNAKAALFTKAAHEIVELVVAVGGRADTALGLAGVGDQLVTSIGGRNRLYGEMVGAGDPPDETLTELEGRGLTVEGVDSTRDVMAIAARHGLDLPFHAAVHRVLFDDADPRDILEVLR